MMSKAGGVQVPLSVQGIAWCLAITWLKSISKTKNDGPGNYKYGRKLWMMEALGYLYVVVLFYWQSLIVVEDLSGRYKAVMKRRDPSPRVSGLHESWLSNLLGNRPMDLKDAQYHEFRDSLPMVAALMVVYLTGAVILRRFGSNFSRQSRVQMRALYIAGFGLAAGVVFHQADILKILVLASMNFLLCHAVIRLGNIAPLILWTCNLAILYLNDIHKGYSFVAILGDNPWTSWLENQRGDLQWHHSFNFIMLRMMSFNMDFWWRKQSEDKAARGEDTDAKDKPKIHLSKIWKEEEGKGFHENSTAFEIELQESSRIRNFHPEFVYRDVILYFAYLLYLPLYVAGPTITFNSFVSFLAVPQQTYSTWGKIRYGFRFLATLLLFEVLTHYIYVGALSYMAFRYRIQEQIAGSWKSTPILVYLTRKSETGEVLDYEQVVFYSYWALMYLWFKFMLIWRLFRLWAVCDDVEPVENMERCMNNNYTVGGFWRAWHRSFNRWLVRYIYVPLGGNGGGMLRKAFNILVVFTFVGYWHDLKIELFAWGWLLSLFFVPEIIAERIGRTTFVKEQTNAHPLLASWVVSFCGALNIVMLKIANIVGYTTGIEGAKLLIPALQTWDGAVFAFEYLLFMTIGVQVMLFIRDSRGEEVAVSKRN